MNPVPSSVESGRRDGVSLGPSSAGVSRVREMNNSSEGWLDLVDTFRSARLPVPPVPESLRDDVEAVEQWNWGTQPLRRQAMYDLAPSLVERLVALPKPCFAVSHGGGRYERHFVDPGRALAIARRALSATPSEFGCGEQSGPGQGAR